MRIIGVDQVFRSLWTSKEFVFLKVHVASQIIRCFEMVGVKSLCIYKQNLME